MSEVTALPVVWNHSQLFHINRKLYHNCYQLCHSNCQLCHNNCQLCQNNCELYPNCYQLCHNNFLQSRNKCYYVTTTVNRVTTNATNCITTTVNRVTTVPHQVSTESQLCHKKLLTESYLCHNCYQLCYNITNALVNLLKFSNMKHWEQVESLQHRFETFQTFLFSCFTLTFPRLCASVPYGGGDQYCKNCFLDLRLRRLNRQTLIIHNTKICRVWAVVVAQLVEQLLPISEVRSSDPVIGKKYIEHLLLTVLKRWK